MNISVTLPPVGLTRVHVQQSINVIEQLIEHSNPPAPVYIALCNTKHVLRAVLEGLPV